MPLPSTDTVVSYPAGAVTGTATVLYTEPQESGLIAVLLDATPCHPVDAGWPDQGPDRATIAWGHSVADVLDCVWAIFACRRVGRVLEVLPGEVMVPDPWGTLTRGQYALVDLVQADAARSRFLRIRPSSERAADRDAPTPRPAPGDHGDDPTGVISRN
jgi:hypothetical protein